MMRIGEWVENSHSILDNKSMKRYCDVEKNAFHQ